MSEVISFAAEGHECGYMVANTMVNNDALPLTRELTPFDLALFAQVAAIVRGIPERPERNRKAWEHGFEGGYLERLKQYAVLGMVQIQRWTRNGQFGVANAPARFHDQFREWGGVQTPAHYGFVPLDEHFCNDSWIFPPEMWNTVVRALEKAYDEEQERKQAEMAEWKAYQESGQALPNEQMQEWLKKKAEEGEQL